MPGPRVSVAGAELDLTQASVNRVACKVHAAVVLENSMTFRADVREPGFPIRREN
jgi:hypothetical protein